MAVVESTGTSMEIKGQYENIKNLLGGCFLFFPPMVFVIKLKGGIKMDFENVLKNAEENEITKEEALYLFQEAQSWDKALKLFETAGKVRDEEVGRVCKLMGFICCITHCTTDPTCSYCFRWASPSSFAPEMVLSAEELADAAKAIEETGVKRIEIAGGTLWEENECAEQNS